MSSSSSFCDEPGRVQSRDGDFVAETLIALSGKTNAALLLPSPARRAEECGAKFGSARYCPWWAHRDPVRKRPRSKRLLLFRGQSDGMFVCGSDTIFPASSRARSG